MADFQTFRVFKLREGSNLFYIFTSPFFPWMIIMGVLWVLGSEFEFVFV